MTLVDSGPATGHRPVVATDFTDPDLYTEGVPFEKFDELRRQAPLWWNPTAKDDGYWVVTRHRDVKDVSLRNDVFSSHAHTSIIDFGTGINEAEYEIQKQMLQNLDNPDHMRLRKIVQKVFSARSIAALRPRLEKITAQVVDRAVEHGEGDFVADVAARLPLQAIMELMGVPLADQDDFFRWSTAMIGFDDPEMCPSAEDGRAAAANVYLYANRMAEERRARPADDIVSALVHADVDGGKLTEGQFELFFLLLMVAGNETSRAAITHGVLAFLDHPGQWELYRRLRPPTAVGEILRWSTPINAFQRTAVKDTEVGGVAVRAGERLGLFYCSANRDPDVFADPDRFDVLRDPNPHLSFGGGGVHHCLGAGLAKLELEILFNALADRVPDISLLQPPQRLRSYMLNSIKHLFVSYRRQS